MDYNIGNDNLAGVLYPDEVMQSLIKGDSMGIFLTTFKNKQGKDAKGLIKKICKKGILSELTIHLAPFDKSHAYPIKALEKDILKYSKWCETVAKTTSTRIFISPFCEHNYSEFDMFKLFQKIEAVAPHCDFVNSIWKGQEVPHTRTEIHITSAKDLPPIPQNEFNISFDGFGGDGSGDFPDADIQKIILHYAASGRLKSVRGWNFRQNGKFGHKDEAPVTNRTHLPNLAYLMGTRATLLPREGEKWPDNKLYKSFADDHGNEPLAQTKDCHAMCILPDIDAQSVTVFDSKNNIIEHMYRVKPDSPKPKGKRYYSKYFAVQLAEMAYKKTKSYLIRIGNNSPIDGRLRSGLTK